MAAFEAVDSNHEMDGGLAIALLESCEEQAREEVLAPVKAEDVSRLCKAIAQGKEQAKQTGEPPVRLRRGAGFEGQ